jgi:hypothetical protein
MIQLTIFDEPIYTPKSKEKILERNAKDNALRQAINPLGHIASAQSSWGKRYRSKSLGNLREKSR